MFTCFPDCYVSKYNLSTSLTVRDHGRYPYKTIPFCLIVGIHKLTIHKYNILYLNEKNTLNQKCY